jgi:polyisoprenoid-binding protein YceI
VNGSTFVENYYMKKIFYPAAASVIILASAFTFVASQNWKVSEGYEIRFTSEDPSGVFTDLKGEIVFDEKDLSTAMFKMKVAVNSINTGNGMQNQHAVSPKWFDAEKYPEIKFASRSVEKTEKGYVAHGTMSIHGVDKEFDIPFVFENKGVKGIFRGKFDINRNDFKIGDPAGSASAVLKIDLTVPVAISK